MLGLRGNTVKRARIAGMPLGDREYFLDRPYSIGGGRKDYVP
jgi:hypothetical protein